MSALPQFMRAITVIDAINEAQILDYHGNLEDDLLPPQITRSEVEDELCFDLFDGAMRGAW